MTEKVIQVECKLDDCIYYHVEERRPGVVFCRHLEKPHYYETVPCPLYRLDWKKQNGQRTKQADYLKMLRKR